MVGLGIAAIGRAERLANHAIRAGFVCLVVSMSWNQPAWDLTASYVAGRLVASGQAAALYDQVGVNAAGRAGSAWSQAALAGGIPGQTVTAFVQTPLWAWIVAPLASHVSFDVFKRVFAFLSASCLAGMIAVAAAQWAPRLARPAWQAGLLFGLAATVPFNAGIVLGQTHTLFLYVSILAAVQALRGRAAPAGLLLALAAAVKITPGWLALAWLVAGRWRAAAWFAASSAMLALATLALTGPDAFAAYLRTLRSLGASVMLSFNNDSLASVLMGGALDQDTAFRFKLLPIPASVGLACLGAAVLGACVAGLLDRKHAARPARQPGAIFALVAATAFTPLAWNHYFIVLVLPVMLFLDAARGPRRLIFLAAAAIVILLNVPPAAYTIGAPLAAVARRSHFWAAMLCLFVIAFLPRGIDGPCIAARDEPA